jgi:hypothetical protein
VDPSCTEPASFGGAISDYVIQYRSTSAMTYTTYRDAVLVDLNATLAGLRSGSSFYIKVAAKTEFGTGTNASPELAKTQVGSGSSVTVRRSTLSGLAPAPTGLAGTASLTGMELTWNSLSTTSGGGSVTDYNMRYRTKEATTWITVARGVSTSTNHTISGLTRNKSYEFAVAAKTADGTSSGTTGTITGLTRSRAYDTNVYARALAGSTALTGSRTTLRTSTHCARRTRGGTGRAGANKKLYGGP